MAPRLISEPITPFTLSSTVGNVSGASCIYGNNADTHDSTAERIRGSLIWNARTAFSRAMPSSTEGLGPSATFNRVMTLSRNTERASHSTNSGELRLHGSPGRMGGTSHVTMLTLNVRGPRYLGLPRSILWLLMPWLLTSPGHQQPWYWFYRISRSFFCLRRNFNYLCLISVEEWQKI